MQSHQLKIASLPYTLHNYLESGQNKKKRKTFRFSSFRWGAVGETRTRTGLLPLPPQSSVSTISPPPLCFGIAKVRTIFKLPNLFAKILNFFGNISLTLLSSPSKGLFYIYKTYVVKCWIYGIYYIPLHAFPRVGKHSVKFINYLKQIHNGC